jgi:regulator of sigma E protease
LLVQRVGEPAPIELEVAYKIRETEAYERPDHRRVGVGPEGPAFVSSLQANSPATDAGLEVGDEILEANGEKLYSPMRLVQMVESGNGAPISLVVKRGAENKTLTLTPRQPAKGPVRKGPDGEDIDPPERIYQTGIVWDGSKGRTIAPGPPPQEQLAHSATAMFRTLKAVTSKDSDIKVSHMSSAVGIGGLYYDALSVKGGWRWALAISVLINVNLALLNLLPLPVLDGGHITMALYEAVRKKPLNIRILEYVQISCVLLLFGFMAYVTFFDIGDRVRRGGETTTEIVWES